MWNRNKVQHESRAIPRPLQSNRGNNKFMIFKWSSIRINSYILWSLAFNRTIVIFHGRQAFAHKIERHLFKIHSTKSIFHIENLNYIVWVHSFIVWYVIVWYAIQINCWTYPFGPAAQMQRVKIFRFRSEKSIHVRICVRYHRFVTIFLH